jgi:hypothetical protein
MIVPLPYQTQLVGHVGKLLMSLKMNTLRSLKQKKCLKLNFYAEIKKVFLQGPAE